MSGESKTGIIRKTLRHIYVIARVYILQYRKLPQRPSFFIKKHYGNELENNVKIMPPFNESQTYVAWPEILANSRASLQRNIKCSRCIIHP